MAKKLKLDLEVDSFKRSGVKIVTSRLIKIYKTEAYEVQALRGVDLEVEAGDVVSIMGPSGSGKTTLLNMIGGVDRPTGGKVYFGKLELTSLKESDLEIHRLANVGYVFQTFNLIPNLTALENVELPMAIAGVPKSIRVRRAKWLLSLVNLSDKLHRYPDELSGGEQQRVAIATALANDPPVILADEPTAELDSDTARVVIDLLTSLSKKFGKTVIIATHDPRVAIKTNKIIRLEDGLITGTYTPLEIETVGVKHVTLSELVKMRLASIQKEIDELMRQLREGKITIEQFVSKYNKIKNLENALKELLSSIGSP
ncbi:MAG TPA: ABC transporter ATP-binding protein [Acidilobales archaeon]|nr:ABC transporter ATP-binding protein [Acidilobales archaeon]